MLLATDSRNSVLVELASIGLNRCAYTPYGFQSGLRHGGSRLGFNGELRDELTGCYHLGNGHRLYNPVLMRFYSPDRLSPFGKGGLNPYAYCVGDPVNFTDPTGEVPEWLQPVLLIGLNVVTTIATLVPFVTPVAAPVGAALWAARITLIASPISILGSGLQLGGVKEGKTLSAIGTAVSGLAVGTRALIGINNWLSLTKTLSASTRWEQAKHGLGGMVGFKPKLVPGPVVRTSLGKAVDPSYTQSAPGRLMYETPFTKISGGLKRHIRKRVDIRNVDFTRV